MVFVIHNDSNGAFYGGYFGNIPIPAIWSFKPEEWVYSFESKERALEELKYIKTNDRLSIWEIDTDKDIIYDNIFVEDCINGAVV